MVSGHSFSAPPSGRSSRSFFCWDRSQVYGSLRTVMARSPGTGMRCCLPARPCGIVRHYGDLWRHDRGRAFAHRRRCPSTCLYGRDRCGGCGLDRRLRALPPRICTHAAWPAPVGKQSSPAATFRTTSLTWRKARPGTPQYRNDSLLCDVGGRVSRKAGSDIKLIKSTPPSVS